jgi:hypothetical protein
MLVNGRLHSHNAAEPNPEWWQVHIPLRNVGHVIVYRDRHAQADALLVDGFIEVVQRVLTSLYQGNRVGVVRFDSPEAFNPRMTARSAVAGKTVLD